MGAMDKFTGFLEEKLMPIAGRVGEQKHLQSVRDGILMTVPFLIVGSVFLVLGFIPVPGYNEFMAGIFGDAWLTKLMYPVAVTFDLMAIVACLGISYRLSEKYKVVSTNRCTSCPYIFYACYTFYDKHSKRTCWRYTYCAHGK